MKKDHLSRRRLVQSGAAVLTALSMPALAKGAAPRALALIGDRYHNADYIRLSLNKTFEALNMPIDYTIDTASISASLLKKYDLFLPEANIGRRATVIVDTAGKVAWFKEQPIREARSDAEIIAALAQTK